ncbi:glutathione S-transferase [Aquipseudomonas alcaligenes]|uniref:glutathione S-transferase n=1 Tax=Aquipseudomonas alcaligenes TaxID=43263 RepID=UPI00374A8B48
MLTIWGRRNSTNVRKVLWCAEEAGIAYQALDAGGAFGLVDEPAYRLKNPNGLVPMIEDGDLILWESNAIVRYLSAAYAEESLWLTDPRQRSAGDKWMDWTTSTFAPVFRDLFWGLVRTPLEQRDTAVIERARTRCAELLAIADAELAKRPWLSGERFAMGDIPLGSFAYAWFEMPIERPPLPYLEQWYAQLCERPAFRTAVMTPLT